MGLIERLITWAFGTKCSHCGSRRTEYSYKYTRGWNHLCQQACGDSGFYCLNCRKITWDKTLKEYKAILPNWCEAYERKG